MDLLRILLSRCAALFRRKELDAELDEELQSHIDFAFEENVARGLSEEEARRAALVRFGGVTQTREAYRVRRGMPFLEQMVRDVRFGLRQLRRSSGFAVTAILTLALGLGANTAVFSLINALMLRPLPVPHAEELAVLRIDRSDQKAPSYFFCGPVFRALEKRHEAFQDSAAFADFTLQVRSGSGIAVIPGALVSGEFFHALQTQPLLGRVLTPMDDQPGGGGTGFGVVISEGFWRSWFNSAPDVVGRKLTIANSPFTVVGVMPKRFIGADATERPEIYAPLWAEPVIHAPFNMTAAGYRISWLRVVARRAPGVSLEQANAALRAASNPILDESVPDATWVKAQRSRHFQFAAEPGTEGYSDLRSAFKKPLIAVFSMCGAMLLLACLNLASLLMARAAARERELATRLAMGATRGRLIRQLMMESLLIAVLGTAAGLAVAPLVSRSLAALLVGRSRFTTLDTSLDLRVYLFAVLIAALATVLVGLIPALRATSGNLNEQIKNGSHAASAQERKRWLPRVLLGLEVALALMLVVGAGLLGTSLSRLYHTGLGFEPKGVINLDLDMKHQPLDGEALVRWYQAFGDALGHQPRVKSVSFASVIPLSGGWWDGDFHTPLSHGDREIYMNAVAPAYFQTMRIPIAGGRDFQWSDTRTSSPKIILSRSAAKTLFSGQNAIGQQVMGEEKKIYEVIGVVGDTQYASIKEAAPAEAYLPITQDDSKKPSYAAVVRMEGSAVPLAAAARALAARMAPEIQPPVMTTISDNLDASIKSERMMALLAAFFAGCALLVTAIGLYGTLAYATARRTSEIGIRMALGARRAQVVGMVFRENAWIAVVGSLAGLGAALLASRMLASFLYGTSARDPWVMAASVGALAVIASAASLVPAVRAARVEPMTALRTE
jgi:predicted permease